MLVPINIRNVSHFQFYPLFTSNFLKINQNTIRNKIINIRKFKKKSINSNMTTHLIYTKRFEFWVHKNSIINSSEFGFNINYCLLETFSSCNNLNKIRKNFGLTIEPREINFNHCFGKIKIYDNGIGFDEESILNHFKSLSTPFLPKKRNFLLHGNVYKSGSDCFDIFLAKYLRIISKKIDSENLTVLNLDTKTNRVFFSRIISKKTVSFVLLDIKLDQNSIKHYLHDNWYKKIQKNFHFKPKWLFFDYIFIRGKKIKTNFKCKKKIQKKNSRSFLSSSIKFIEKKDYLNLFNKLDSTWNYPFCMLHFSFLKNIRIDIIIFIPVYSSIDFLYNKYSVTNESNFFKFEGYNSGYLLENFTPKWLFFGIGSIKVRDSFYLENNKKNIKYADKIELKKKISKKMKELLSNFSFKQPICYDLFWMNHSQKLKFNLIKNKNFIKSFSHLLRFFSTRSNCSIISLRDYVLNMKQNQKEIYYFLVKNNVFSKDRPSFEILSKNGIEVLLIVDTIDEMLIENLEKSQSIWKKKKLFFKKIGLIECYENFSQMDLKKINKKWDPSNCIELFSGELSKKFFGVQASYQLFSSSSNFVFLKNTHISSFKSQWNIKNKKTEKKIFLENNQKFIFEINVSNNLIRVLNKYLQLKKSKKITKEIGILILEITNIKCGNFLTDEIEFSKRIENFLTIFLLIIYSEYLGNIVK